MPHDFPIAMFRHNAKIVWKLKHATWNLLFERQTMFSNLFYICLFASLKIRNYRQNILFAITKGNIVWIEVKACNMKLKQKNFQYWNVFCMLESMFSQIKLLCFGETPFPSDQKYNILATAKLCIRQSCTKLCRVETWILCFPSETKK